MSVEIRPARTEEADALLPLMRAYCDFYEVDPPDEGLLEMARALSSDPEQGALLVAAEGDSLVGFAALGWKWSSTRGARIVVMEDLFVHPDARGSGVADDLIKASADLSRERGAPVLEWVTALDNKRAQAVYNRVGGEGDEWMIYELKV